MRILAFILISLPLNASITTLKVGDRAPSVVYLPSNYSQEKKLPLVISIHGLMSNPKFQEKIFPARKFIDKKDFILITPFGKRNRLGFRFWNVNEKCCDFFRQNPDDISYIKEIILKAQEKFSIHPKKIFLVGHSNGGMLAYKFACEAPELINGIVSIAGVNFSDEQNCKKSKPVSILQIHGKNDFLIKYNGNERRGFPSAIESTLPWISLNNCKGPPDYISSSKMERIIFKNCQENSFVENWTFQKRRHNSFLSEENTEKILNSLF